jgi:hypothetical protein
LLAAALREVMTSEAGLLQGEEYVGLLIVLKAATRGAFEVRMCSGTMSEDQTSEPQLEEHTTG